MKPKLIIIAGPNGSGKTSVTGKILEHEWVEDCLYINPDNIARDTFGDWNSPKATLEAAQLSEKMREECLTSKKSICFETVMSAPDKLDYIKRAKEAGYFIRLFFVGTDTPMINASRIVLRVIEGGHDVPIPKIISRYSKSIAQCCIAVRMVDRAYIYDNSIEFQDPRLLFKVIDGSLGKVYSEVNNWAKIIKDSLG